MKIRTKTFTLTKTYHEFTPGEAVLLVRDRGSLPPGPYVVTEFHHPSHSGDEPLVFVEGYPFGLDPNQFWAADEEGR